MPLKPKTADKGLATVWTYLHLYWLGGSYGQGAAWREGGDHLNTVLEQMGFVQAKEDMERAEEGKGTTDGRGGHSLIFKTS